MAMERASRGRNGCGLSVWLQGVWVLRNERKERLVVANIDARGLSEERAERCRMRMRESLRKGRSANGVTVCAVTTSGEAAVRMRRRLVPGTGSGGANADASGVVEARLVAGLAREENALAGLAADAGGVRNRRAVLAFSRSRAASARLERLGCVDALVCGREENGSVSGSLTLRSTGTKKTHSFPSESSSP